MASRERIGPLLPVWPTAPVREREERVGDAGRRPAGSGKQPRRPPRKDRKGGIDTYAHGRFAAMGGFEACRGPGS